MLWVNINFADWYHKICFSVQFSSVQSLSGVRLFATPWITRPSCPSQTPGVYSNSCPWSRWCHPAISSSVVPFSSCPQSLPPSGSFPMSQLFAWGGQSIGASASASVLPMNTQDVSPKDGLVGSPCSPRHSQESSPKSAFSRPLFLMNYKSNIKITAQVVCGGMCYGFTNKQRQKFPSL